MQHQAISIRPFIGARDFNLSRSFYRDLGFEETVLSYNMSVFKINDLAFYLQDYYVQDWIDNTMLFFEVEDVHYYWQELVKSGLDKKYPGVRFTPVKTLEWGSECFVHDPSGVLLHFGAFAK